MDLNISLAPQVLFYFGNFPVTNTLFWTVILSVSLSIIIFIIRFSLTNIPGRLQNIFEVLLEQGFSFVDSVVGDKKKAKKIFPLVFSIFVFTLCANLIPYIFPGQSAISIKNGDQLVPFFRSIMSDYGFVLLLTLMVVIITQVAAIAIHGPFGYTGGFINLKGFGKFVKEALQGRFEIGSLLQGLLDFILGLMDIIGEIAKIVSLSFRLFGNIFTGEVLTVVILSLMPFFLPLPFMFLGLLAAVVQAFVFSMLTLISITMATELNEAEEVT